MDEPVLGILAPVAHWFLAFLLRNLEFFQFRDESFPCLPRLHGLVNGKDLPVRTNIESPSVREFARSASVSEYSVRCSCFLTGISKNRKIRVFLFGERCVVFELIRTDHEILEVVFLDDFPALTERATFGRSTTGEGFRKPSQYDGFPLQFRERIGLAIASLEREIRRSISDLQLLSHCCSSEDEESSQRDGHDLVFSFHIPSWALYLFSGATFRTARNRTQVFPAHGCLAIPGAHLRKRSAVAKPLYWKFFLTLLDDKLTGRIGGATIGSDYASERGG
jgi:hypothetical protein